MTKAPRRFDPRSVVGGVGARRLETRKDDDGATMSCRRNESLTRGQNTNQPRHDTTVVARGVRAELGECVRLLQKPSVCQKNVSSIDSQLSS